MGKGVYWTTRLEISDRQLIEIGDNVVFGHGIGIYAHAIEPRKNDLRLYLKKVKIGNRVFLGGGCRLGPGVEVSDSTYVPVATDLYPNRKISKLVDRDSSNDIEVKID